MTRYTLTPDEWYPVFTLTEPYPSQPSRRVTVELDDALVARYEAAMKEFEAVQTILYDINERERRAA